MCLRFSFIWQLKSYLPTSHTQLMLRSLQRHHHLTFLQVTLNPACTLALTSDSQFTLSPTLPTNHSPTMFLSENYSLLHPCLQSPGLVSLSSLLSFVGKTLKHLLSIFVIFLVNLKVINWGHHLSLCEIVKARFFQQACHICWTTCFAFTPHPIL